MKISGLEFTEKQVIDVATTFLFVFVAVIVPGYIQMHTGISAIRLSFLITLVYLVIHLFMEHRAVFHKNHAPQVS